MSRCRGASLAAGLLSLAVVSLPCRARASDDDPLPLAPVDRDDDDGDGVPDGEARVLRPEARVDLVEIPRAWRGAVAPTLATPAAARLLLDGKPVASGSALPARGSLAVQGLRPGRVGLRTERGVRELRFVEVRLFDNLNEAVDPVKSGWDIARAPPSRLVDDPFAPSSDNTVRAVLIGHPADLEGVVSLSSVGPDGRPLDALAAVETREVPCPADAGGVGPVVCRSTLPIRLAFDAVDRAHPVSRDRSLLGELGGGVSVAVSGRKLLMSRVLGPRHTEIGPVGRFRGRLRVLLVRDRPKGAPPFAASDPAAIRLARAQVERTNAVWGQCGVSFGPPELADVRLVDPPVGSMLAFGCDLGLPASGGEVRVRVDGLERALRTERGESPREVSRRFARLLEAAKLGAVVSDNLRIGPGADASSDVLVRRKDGTPALIEPPEGGSVSTDPTLSVCIGGVDFSDGLQHFSDVDAVAGTVEERALLRSVDDGDPRTVEILFIPSFATGGRIGESFIHGDRSSLGNMIIEDRAGVRADNVSFALAHELGHVLLDVPGHSDDFGVDTPGRLMDSDAADASAFGPRRLLASECVRALRQSGPPSVPTLLEPWPLAKLPASPRRAAP